MATKKPKLFNRISAPLLPAGLIAFINKFERLILYGLIGGGAVVIDVGLFWLIDTVTDTSVIVNNGVSIATAMVYSFLMNAYFNFKTRTGLFKRFFSFCVVTSSGFLISSVMLWTMSDLLGMPAILVKNLTLPVVFIVQFTLNSKFTFKVEDKQVKDRAGEDLVLESVV
jgi:putative flippase GtrA